MSESVTKSWLVNEWRLIVSLLGPIITIIVTFYALQAKVDLIAYRVDKIENNHLAHVQASLDKLTDALEKLAIQETQTSTLLNEHLNEN